MKKFSATLTELLGVELTPVSHAERFASAAGGLVAILCIYSLSRWLLGSAGAGIVVASMGASAVLLFSVPHGQLSQPWPVFGGHMISAVVGVACAQSIANEVLAAGAAVGLAIGGMYYLRCIHPPGGATALSAVIGGDAIRELGYQYVITPVLLNVAIILAVAVLYNLLFPWRRYPAWLQRSSKSQRAAADKAGPGDISHGDFVYALSQIDSFIDANEYDLLRIYELATNRSHSRNLPVEDVVVGGYYSNGKYGDDWSVRHIVAESFGDTAEKDKLIYKVAAGRESSSQDSMTRMEFAGWAKYRVTREGENWKIVAPGR